MESFKTVPSLTTKTVACTSTNHLNAQIDLKANQPTQASADTKLRPLGTLEGTTSRYLELKIVLDQGD